MWDSLGLSLWNFKQFEELKLNKGFPAQHTDTLRSPYWNTKGGQLRWNRWDKKGRGLRIAMDAALQWGAQSNAHPREGEEVSCGSFFLQLGEAERLGGNSCGSEQYKLQLSQETWARTEQRGSATAFGWLTLQTKKESHRSFYTKWLRKLSVNPRTVSTESLFLLSKVYTLWLIPSWGTLGRGPRSPLPTWQNKEGSQILPDNTTPKYGSHTDSSHGH